jgi:hypothetical protein
MRLSSVCGLLGDSAKHWCTLVPFLLCTSPRVYILGKKNSSLPFPHAIWGGKWVRYRGREIKGKMWKKRKELNSKGKKAKKDVWGTNCGISQERGKYLWGIGGRVVMWFSDLPIFIFLLAVLGCERTAEHGAHCGGAGLPAALLPRQWRPHPIPRPSPIFPWHR